MNLNPFRRKTIIALPDVKKEELFDLAEGQGDEAMQLRIGNAIQKQLDDSSFFQYAENNQEGNYFQSEFNIIATSARIKTTYAKEPWIAATTNLIAKSLSSLPMKVVSATDEDLPNHPLNDQLKSANVLDGELMQQWKCDIDFLLGGNAYIIFDEKYRSSIVVPCEMCTIDINEQTQMPQYLCVGSGKSYRRFPWQQVVHFKFPNPYNMYYGLSLYTAASRPILLDRYKNEFEMAFYLRGATNAGIIETTDEVNKTRMQRLMRTFEAVYTGRRNWWRTIFLPKGAKWVQSGMKMSEMQYLETLRENRLSILACLGVPPAKVGITTDVNRATSETQDKDYWENTIKPIANFKAACWNNSYLVRVIYKGKVKIVPDFDAIEAIAGSMITKGDKAKSMQPFFWIDEIREKIYKEKPLPNNAGQKFVSEVSASPTPIQNSLQLDAGTVVDQPIEDQVIVLSAKQGVVGDQDQLEQKLSPMYSSKIEDLTDYILAIVENALRKEMNILSVLNTLEKKFAEKYIRSVERILVVALQRGFSLAEGQAKQLRDTISNKATFNARDQQAIDALREEQLDGQKTQLLKRSVENFYKFNKTTTSRIMDIIANGVEDGKTQDQIAATIRENYKEKYKGQSNTITRTEILTSVSQGMKWNHDVLKEVFDDVKKQWFHVGDAGSNPDARDNHFGFEQLGVVDSDYKFGGVLSYPRDNSAPADEVINCRCSMVSVIPKDAKSHADIILDKV